MLTECGGSPKANRDSMVGWAGAGNITPPAMIRRRQTDPFFAPLCRSGVPGPAMSRRVHGKAGGRCPPPREIPDAARPVWPRSCPEDRTRRFDMRVETAAAVSQRPPKRPRPQRHGAGADAMAGCGSPPARRRAGWPFRQFCRARSEASGPPEPERVSPEPSQVLRAFMDTHWRRYAPSRHVAAHQEHHKPLLWKGLRQMSPHFHSDSRRKTCPIILTHCRDKC